jgi:hypothetical protein
MKVRWCSGGKQDDEELISPPRELNDVISVRIECGSMRIDAIRRYVPGELEL